MKQMRGNARQYNLDETRETKERDMFAYATTLKIQEAMEDSEKETYSTTGP